MEVEIEVEVEVEVGENGMNQKMRWTMFVFMTACGGVKESGEALEELTDTGTGESEVSEQDSAGSTVVDADGDGWSADDDCDDNDPSMPNLDADCDGVLTEDDCDDFDATSTTRSEDQDCDGVIDLTAETICQRWNLDRSTLQEGQWTGAVNTCDAGAVSQMGIDNALKQVNLFRWLSGLSEVQVDSGLNQKAQECALMMNAYGGLSHYPSTEFPCYTEDGTDAASKSNLSPYAGVYSVDLYMSDPGNETTLGHRRWILSNKLGPIGLGSTDEYSCMWVIGGIGTDAAAWTSWPPSGVVPIDLTELAWAHLDTTGWSVQSDSINLSGADAEIIRDDGVIQPVQVTELGANYGSRWAINMIPEGWNSQAGHRYDVVISVSSGTIEYSVEFVECAATE